MLCQNCNKNEATTHIKRIVNGEATSLNLCDHCATSLGYDDIFDGFNFRIPNLFSSLFSDTPFALKSAKTTRCESCGSSFDDIIRSGVIGCAKCYETFGDKLMSTISRIHGRAIHAGKTPVMHEEVEIQPDETTDDVIAQKTALLEKAIAEQDFELAAVIRDEIKALKEGK